MTSPSLVNWLAYRSRNRARTSAGSEGDDVADQRSVALLETLLTFWPPGPLLRENENTSSSSGTLIVGVTWSIEPVFPYDYIRAAQHHSTSGRQGNGAVDHMHFAADASVCRLRRAQRGSGAGDHRARPNAGAGKCVASIAGRKRLVSAQPIVTGRIAA